MTCIREVHVATNASGRQEGSGHDAKSAELPGIDPRETDHPTGSEQAEENEANDPPS
jgi:hypothetical protein